MGINLTERAASHISKVVAAQGGIGLKLGVKTVGCSGMAYTYDVANAVAEGDIVVEAFGAKLIVGKGALPFVDGSEVDFVREGFKQTLVVNNPNVVSTCGCGESFSVSKPSAETTR